MHVLIGFGVLAGLVAFAFGPGAARLLVGTALVVIALAFAYVMYCAVTGTI